MPKRSTKRRKKRRSSNGPQPGVTRSLDLGPITLFQQGSYFGVQPNPEHPDFEEFRRSQRGAAAQLPAELLDLRRQLSELMAPHHAFDVIFGVWGTYGRIRPSTLTPLGDNSPTTTAEYAAHVLLDRTSPEPLRAASPDEMRTGINPEKVGEIVGELLAHLPVVFTHRQLGAGEDIDPWIELRTRFYMHRLAVRSFTFEQQETETLRGLYTPFHKELAESIGFTVEQALALTRAVAELPMMGAADRAQRARDEADKLRRLVAAHRRGKQTPTDYPIELLAKISALPPKRAEQWIVATTSSWAWHAYGRDAAFTASDLAEHAGASLPVAQAFLSALSVEFGARADSDRWQQDPERALGGEMEVMRSRPIVHDGAGKYLPIANDSLFYGLRDLLADVLKADQKRWQRFQRHRGRLLEERALTSLATALRADWSYGAVKYRWTDEDGKQQEGEADGVLRCDSLIVLIESKAGSFAPSARRAAPDRLEKELRDLISAAAEQLRRDEEALIEGSATTVTARSGAALELDVAEVLRVVRIAVTLEDLSSVAPGAWRLQEAGLLPAAEQAPWIVGIHELELICRLTERPAQLAHYILRRQRANRQRIWGMDEMDFFMRYLQSGLFWEDAEVHGAYMELGNHTDQLDAWWYGELGLRKPVKRPRQRLNRATRQLLDDIEATEMPGRLEAQLMLLDMAQPARERVAAGLRTLSKKTERDGMPHDMTLVFGQDFAVTLHSNPQMPTRVMSERLADHGQKRFEMSRLRRWLGLATLANRRPRVSSMALIMDPQRLPVDEPDGPLHIDPDDPAASAAGDLQ